LVKTRGQGGRDFVNNAILGPLKAERTAVLDRIATAIGRHAARPEGLAKLADCAVDGQRNNTGNNNGQQDSDQGQQDASPSAAPSTSATPLPDPQGPTSNCPTTPVASSGRRRC